MALAPKGAALAELLTRYQGLPPTKKLVMQLKALIGSTTNKSDFVSAMVATGSRAPDGKAWSYKSISEVLGDLRKRELLDDGFTCPGALLHPLAADAASGPDAKHLIEAVRATFPSVSPRAYAYNYSLQTDENAARRLRLAIYANDEAEYSRLLDLYAKDYDSAEGPHVLESWFLRTPVGFDWLISRALPIQHGIFAIKLSRLLMTGTSEPDFDPLLNHYSARRKDPGHAAFDRDLLEFDVLSGRLTDVRERIAGGCQLPDHERLAFLGTLAFLTGRNADAIEHYREALKLYRKHVHKRKVFLQGSHGLFFLMALLRASDVAVHAEIQAALDAAWREDTRVGDALAAMQGLLWLLQGQDGRARELVAKLRAAMPAEPLSAACVALAEYLTDAEMAREHVHDTHTRFERLKAPLPLVARIYAEVLAGVAADPARYQAFLREADTDGAMVAFTSIVAVRPPWERSLDSLAVFLQGTGSGTAAQPAARKAKRLAWFVDPESRTVEALEQSAKGRDGWSDGRTIAMKRLFEQDPRLSYLSEHDRRVLRTIRKEVYGWYDEDRYDFDPYKTLLALVGHPVVFDARRRLQAIELVSYPVELIVAEKRDGYRISLSHQADAPAVFLEAETPSRYRVVDVSPQVLAVQEILGKSGLRVPRAGRDRVVALVRAQEPALPIRAEIDAIDALAVEGSTVPVIQLQPLGPGLEQGLRVALMVRPFGDEGPHYLAGQGGRSVLAMVGGRRQRANRDLDGERAAATALVAACPTLQRIGDDGHEWLIEEPESCLDLLLELQECGQPVGIEWPEGKPLRVSGPISPARLSLKVNRARDWFHLTGSLTIDEDLVLDMSDLLERLGRAPGRFIPLDDGRFVTLTTAFRKQLERLRTVSETDRDGRRLSAFSSVAVRDLIEDAGAVEADRHWQALAARIRAASEHAPIVPSTLQAELRDYQVEGFAWLSRLAHWGAGACLADDMGLGKTVQAIAAMLEQAAKGPCLVVAPTSVCHNWEAELARFAPTLRTRRFAAGSDDRAALISGLRAMDVLITSYGLLHQEADRLAEVSWQMAVLDEAQAIKNADTRRAQASQRLQAAFRVALTGTPIENYLDELWSLFNVINPGLLGSRDSFQRRFVTPIERDRDLGAREGLRALIRPFILRRTKSAVLNELPPRTEVTIDVELPDEERAFYEALRRKALKSIEDLQEGTAGQRRIHILAEITRLRRACCHPALVDPNTALPGAKLGVFLELVQELIRNRHKALVFSQFVGQLERVRDALDAQGIRFQYLDGSTPAKERERRVAAFQAGDGVLFLISLRAGGLGLNLTAADYVIHLDPWWNPAVEDQASDRAHRIGQQRPVTVYRLIVDESIEQKIVRLHKDKRDLAADILEGSELSARLTEEALIELLHI
ncbi:MAG: DEAD/DEAH box helicase [Defluviicoccus sp.]